MKKFCLSVLSIFYNYYDKGSTQVIAYESSIAAVILLMFLNFLAISIGFDLGLERLINIDGENKKVFQYLIGSSILIPLYLIFSLLFKKSELKKFAMNRSKNKFGGFAVTLYIILSMLAIVIAVKN